MAPAVSVKLADVSCQVTSLDAFEFEDVGYGFKPRCEAALWLAPVPTAGRISSSHRRSPLKK